MTLAKAYHRFQFHILCAVCVLLSTVPNTWAFFLNPARTEPPHTTPIEPHFITNVCEKYDSQQCDPVTNKCKDAKSLEYCPPPSTATGRNQCYASWFNTPNGIRFLRKGCWLNNHECQQQRQCVHKPPTTEIFFCCCEGNLCNQNVSVFQESSNTVEPLVESRAVDDEEEGGDGATLVPPIVKDTSQTMKAVLCSILPIIGMTVAIILVFFLWKRHRHNAYTRHQQVPTIEPGYITIPSSSAFDLDLLERIEMCARGRFGCVWKARLASEVVALKIFPLQDKQSWTTEQSIYSLPQMSHKNVLRFITSEKRGDNLNTEFWLLTEFHELGSLYDYLKGHILSWEDLCQIAETMARGLAFLHDELHATATTGRKPAVAHRDFKSKNVLLKADLSACVADFGLAIKFEPGVGLGETHGLVGTRRYMAPEVLEGAICFNRDAFLRIDMYACALVLWELMSRCSAPKGPVGEYQLPFESAEEVGQHPSLEAMQEYVVTQKKRPPIHDHWLHHAGMASLASTVEECWDQDAEARLSAGCVEERLVSLSRSLSDFNFVNDSPLPCPLYFSPPPFSPSQYPPTSGDSVISFSASSDLPTKGNSSC